MYYFSGADCLWVCLSILSLPVEEQLTKINGIKDLKTEDPLLRDPLYVLGLMLAEYQYSFVDDFDFLWNKQEGKMSDIQNHFSEKISLFLSKSDMSKSNREWDDVRITGLAILELTGLPLWIPEESLEVSEFLELVYKDGVLIGYN